MVKRMVILQDEQLVVRELSRAERRLGAYAVVGAGAGGALPSSGGLNELGGMHDYDQGQPEKVALPAPSGRLADVAKAAALKAERAVIEDTLRQVQWNRRRASQLLGVSYKTLLNKIKECGISRR
jgi:DNA-binding NtrC family response regulator